MTYEEFEKKCYELASKHENPEYAKENLDFAKGIKELERFYKMGYSPERVITLTSWAY